MDEWYLIRSDDHDMDKDLVIMAEIMDAVMEMASVMVTCRISVQDPMKNLGQVAHLLDTTLPSMSLKFLFNYFCRPRYMPSFWGSEVSVSQA